VSLGSRFVNPRSTQPAIDAELFTHGAMIAEARRASKRKEATSSRGRRSTRAECRGSGS
jgi:hypothetical protein